MPWYQEIKSKLSELRKPSAEPTPNNHNMLNTNHLFIVHGSDGTEGSSNTDNPGLRELKIKQVTELGDVTSTSTFVKRDLGFQGKLGSHILITYGDTMFSDVEGNDEFRGMTCNSTAIACEEPTSVFDPVLDDREYPRCFLQPSEEYGEDPSVYSLGITNIVETSRGEGIVYFLLNHRPDFKDHLLGAGIAKVTFDTSASTSHPIPIAERQGKFWWDAETEPWYGDICALRSGSHIYAYGHAKDNPWIYLARVKATDATNLDAYEYWNGAGWQSERLTKDDLGEKQGIFWQINQGQIYYSKFHGCYVFVYCDNFWSCQVLMKTALAPEGPWSDPITVHKPTPISEGGNIYAAIPHPYFDPSGRTLVVTYTNHPNRVQAIRVVSRYCLRGQKVLTTSREFED